MTSQPAIWPRVSGPEGSPYGVRATRRRVISMLASLESPLPPMIASTALGVLHGADLRQVAPVALGVHAAAEDEAVGNRQADEIGVDRLGDLELLLDQHRALHGQRAELEQAIADRRHRL